MKRCCNENLRDDEEEEKELMKAVTARMFISLVGVALVVPFFVVALVVGARAIALAQGAQDDLLLVALAFGGALASIINGFGRRAKKQERGRRSSRSSVSKVNDQPNPRSASMIHLGY
jgi:hypothetical protein